MSLISNLFGMSGIFTSADGDAWYERNKDKPRDLDPVMQCIHNNGLHPKNVLEIGCGTGWRLEALREKYECSITGVEISQRAARGKGKFIHIADATGVDLIFNYGEFDLVIFGFMLYLAPRNDLFRIITNADYVLANGGHIIIHDFFHDTAPYARIYGHNPNLLSYHQDYAKMFLSHPAYSRVVQVVDAKLENVVDLLRKDLKNAYPIHEE